jgi:integrase
MTGKIMPLGERDTSTIQAAADAFLSSPRYASPNTRRGYTGVLDRLLAGLGAGRPPAEVSRGGTGLLEQLWGQRAPATWNRNRGAVAAWVSWCAASRLPAPVLPASAGRRREHLNATRAVPRPAIDRALSRRDVPVRD